MTLQPVPPSEPSEASEAFDYEATLTALAPYLQEVVADVTAAVASVRDELEASEPETLLTQLADVTAELLELIEILASRPLNQRQLQVLSTLEVAANNTALKARDVCETFEV